LVGDVWRFACGGGCISRRSFRAEPLDGIPSSPPLEALCLGGALVKIPSLAYVPGGRYASVRGGIGSRDVHGTSLGRWNMDGRMMVVLGSATSPEWSLGS
jgi:hypothetical protein